MDSNYANAGGGVGGGGTAMAAAVANGRYNAGYYKDPLSCERSVAYNAYNPYGSSSVGVRASSAYPYDADAEFKERTGMGKAKTTHLQMAGSASTNSVKVQQQYSYPNSCYGGYNQNTTESANYYAYAYDQHHLYPQQQQYHQTQIQQQYKYNENAKVTTHQQQQLQQQNLTASAVNAMKMSSPEYGYAPYHHLQHPYYHPHYHQPQKGGVNVMKTIPDASAMPYVNSKMLHSTAMGGTRAPQYPSNYSYHPHSYPSSVSAGHHTYQSQSVCDDSRWMWSGSTGSEYQNSCRSAYPAYVNGSTAKQAAMWPMQCQNSVSTGYSAAAVGNQNCCPPAQSAATYYPQQYVKYPVQSLPTAMDYNCSSSSSNDLYSSSQVNSVLSATPASGKVYTDLNAQPQASSYQTMNASSVSYSQPSDYNASTALDYNAARYLQQQQTDSPSSSSTSSTSPYNPSYYHNLHPYAHQAYSTAEPQDELYAQQQADSKIGITTKSQSLRDFLTTWNEDEDDCTDRTMSSTDVPFMEQLHLTAEHFNPTQDNGLTNTIVENHLQFKGSFTSRPKIHVGITVDSTVESDQYINLPDIIIDIEKSNKDVLSLPEDILLANIPKIEKEEIPIKEELQSEAEEDKQLTPPKTPNDLCREKKKFRRKFSPSKRLAQLKKLRQAQRNQRKPKKVPRKLLRPKIRRVKKPPPPARNPQSLKCLCVSLINSDKFRNRLLTTDVSVAVAIAAPGSDISSSSPSVIPKLSDLCKNALNSSFDRDVLVINLDEILDSDNLFVVQCDINENIENYVDQQLQLQQQQQQHESPDDADLVEILNDNNNNYNSGSNYNATASGGATTTIGSDIQVTPAAIDERKRCSSVSEVSNLPLDNAVEHNNSNSNTNPLVHSMALSPCSSSCPASLCCPSSALLPSLLIEQNCPTTQQITVGHEQLHDEMLMLSGIVPDEDDSCHHHSHHSNGDTLSDDGELLLLASAMATPSIHHEEIVPDNLKKFQNEKFLKYLHAKYVQGNLSEFYHANRIIKKYKKRIIKKILNIVR